MQPQLTTIPHRHIYLNRPLLPKIKPGNTNGIWFDPAHQHFLILSGRVVFSWSLREKYANPTASSDHLARRPSLSSAAATGGSQQQQQQHAFSVADNASVAEVTPLYQDDFFTKPVNNSNPADPINPKCYLIKVSLDMKLLACQVSTTCVIVFDIENKNNWVVNFKDDKKILPAGIVWSEHGGNSQDLIIVTTKGLELYKVSSVRSQCKLSRSITQNISYFWYDPCHRMMLIASTIKSASNTIGCSLSGVFFKYDSSNSIKLELPPPDRSPSFDLMVPKDNISLVSIHNSIYCYCLNRVTESGNTNLLLYCITKSSVTRTHILSLNIAAKYVRTSVLDNLLLCHCLEIQKTIIFDISLPASKTVDLEDGSSAQVWQPISTSNPVCFNASEINSNPTSNTSTSTSSNSSAESEDVKYGSPTPSITLSSSTPNRPAKLPSSNPNVDWDDAVGIGRSDIVPIGLKSGLQKGGNIGSNHNPSILTETVESVASANVKKEKASYTIAAEMYSNLKWIFLSPCWIWDATRHCVWRLAIDLNTVSASIHEVKRQILFLSRRGLPLITPKLAYFTAFDCDEGPEAKNLLIKNLKSSLEAKMALHVLDHVFKTFLGTYINENGRLIKFQQGNSFDSSGSGVQRVNSMTLEQQVLAAQKEQLAKTTSVPVPSKRFSWNFGRSAVPAAVNSQSSDGSGGGSSSGSSAESPSTQISFCTQEPLEPSYSLNAYLPSISSVSFNVRQDKGFNSNSNMSSNSYNNNFIDDTSRLRTLSDLNIVKSREYTHPKVPLTTRRDEFGSLIVSQTELLCHLWIPLILRKDSDLRYISWALSLYISNLRSAHILVHPALLIMLLHVLLAQRKFLQIARLLQFHFFPDSTEVAMASLEFADIVIDMELSGKKSIRGFHRQSVISAIRAMQQVGLDMLWRLQERASVVRWLLSHGKLAAAMSLCMKRRGGNFRTGLTPASVPATEFFSAAMVAINNYIAKNEKTFFVDKVNFELDLVDVKSPNSTISEDDFTLIKDDNSISSDMAIGKTTQQDEQSCFIENTLHCVYNFIVEWERSVVDVMTSGKSRLASQVSFPSLEGLSQEKNTMFKQLFGFQS